MQNVRNIVNQLSKSTWFKLILYIICLYLFLTSIGLMGHAFKGFGKGFSEKLIQTTSNPFIGLAVGILVTSIVQSSSTTTSMIVAFAASGVLTVRNAIPIVMGANIGTAVTSTIVALGHITRKEEFKRAFAGATLHDFYKIITVIIFLPLELYFHFLEKTATIMANIFCDCGAFKIISPVKAITRPLILLIENLLKNTFGMTATIASLIMLVIAVFVLFLSLYYLVKIMRSLIVGKADGIIAGKGFLAILAGLIFTAIIQSSSVTISLLVPLIAAGVLSLENAFPIILGANVGTTVTAILASLAGDISGIIIAFVHLLFNVFGILIIYPFKTIRAIPLKMARGLANKCAESRKYAIIFVLSVFFLIPGLLIFIYRLFN